MSTLFDVVHPRLDVRAGELTESQFAAGLDLHDGEAFGIALRARMSWVFEQLRPPEPITHDLVLSGAGNSAVARMYLPSKQLPGYWVIMEAEENLSVREYPKRVDGSSKGPRGPSIKVCLLQTAVHTSEGFDWDYLLALWPLMAAARDDWVTTSARPRAPHDRARWEAMVARGGPRHLGIGFGDAEAKRAGQCMFGARFQLPPDIQLGGVVDELHHTAALMLEMAAADAPNPR